MADCKRKAPLLHDNPLCGISTYKDTLNLATGVCARIIGKYEFTGQENWARTNTGYFYAANAFSDYNHKLISMISTMWTHYIAGKNSTNGSHLTNGYACLYCHTTSAIASEVYIRDDTYTTAADFKAYLAAQYAAGTPVTIWYVLATPTTETITVPSGLSGTEEGYLIQDGTPTPTNPIYPTANDVEIWQHSLRKLGTATETIQSGDTIYADGTAITTYTLKGNEEHTGTPSPQNPVMPNGVGERSANLVSMSEPQGDGYLANSVVGITGDGRENIISTQAFFVTEYIPVSEGTYYYYSDLYRATANNAKFMFYNANKEFIGYANRQPALEEQPVYELSSFSAPANAAYMRMNIDKSSTKNCLYTSQLPSYEPYGQYKIPISSGGQTTNIYLGSTQTVRQIYKYVCTGDENWTNNFGASLFMVQGIFNSAPFIPQVDSLSTHYSYKPIQSGFGAGLSHGQYALQRSGTQQQYGYNIALKNTDYTDTTNFKAYLQAQYAAGTPVTVWYVLATPQTAAVNEPLMKIGDYADTLSNAASIPTTEGANSISVDTTVQPSEFTATWTGWHDASVQEWDGSQWNE